MKPNCNHCARRNCNRKESKKRTKFFLSYLSSCNLFLEPKPLKVNMLRIAMYNEIRRWGEIRNVSRIRTVCS